MTEKFILWFADVSLGDIAAVGGKNASLGEIVRALSAHDIRVPDGFATTSLMYRRFIKENQLEAKFQAALSRLEKGETSLQDTGRGIRGMMLDGLFPTWLADPVCEAYAELGRRLGIANPAVAVRSSATAEDLPGASFAGQQETFLNVRGERALLDACKRCFASLFTDRAISYRQAMGIDHLKVDLSVGIQQMVRSDLAGSGVMFSIDTETGFPHTIVVSAAWGLGETVVQGSVNPDKYVVFKPLLNDRDVRPIIEKTRGEKQLKLIYAEGGSRRTRLVETSSVERRNFVLSDEEIMALARWAAIVEDHYGRPMDMEWAKDGETGQMYLVQARPETVHARQRAACFNYYHLKQTGEALVRGAAVGSAIVSGPACVIRKAADIGRFRDGSILVADMTDPDWVPVMRRAAGIVTDFGGVTSHAAIVSRELGLPAIVGTEEGTQVIQDGQEITLSCAEGDVGIVYAGQLDYEASALDLTTIPETRTAIMVNLANPSAAFQWWRLPAKGIGLARMEFIIGSNIKAHPMALVHPERTTPEDQRVIKELTQGHDTPADFFVETLARDIARLSAVFYPCPAIVRMSDFKTNEYAHLVGGKVFEPQEENPMLGFRGASRYYDERYRDGFALECRALRRVREELGFRNVIIMIPFCRTPEEADKVLAVMAEHGLSRQKANLQVYMMCEIPSNVVLAEEFACRFDGFSIGSNDLTQLVLGVDRDSGLLAGLFDERNEAVKRMIAETIDKAHRAGIKVGICGQAPSNYPDFAAFLVKQGIDSISLNPDSFVRVVAQIAEVESGNAQQSESARASV